MKVQNIPVFTVMEILSLLPPKDLIRCKRVCKVLVWVCLSPNSQDFFSIVEEIISRTSYWASFHLSQVSYMRSVRYLEKWITDLNKFYLGNKLDPEAECCIIRCMIIG